MYKYAVSIIYEYKQSAWAFVQPTKHNQLALNLQLYFKPVCVSFAIFYKCSDQ